MLADGSAGLVASSVTGQSVAVAQQFIELFLNGDWSTAMQDNGVPRPGWIRGIRREWLAQTEHFTNPEPKLSVHDTQVRIKKHIPNVVKHFLSDECFFSLDLAQTVQIRCFYFHVLLMCRESRWRDKSG